MKIFLICIGGAVGSILRYLMSSVDYKLFNENFPLNTLIINLLGSFIIGFLWAAFENVTISSNMKMFIFIGIIGSFTTFSTFTFENFHLFKEGQFAVAFLNIFLSTILGVLFVFIGYDLSKFIIKYIR